MNKIKKFKLYVRCMNGQILIVDKLTSLKGVLPTDDQITENVILNKNLQDYDKYHKFTALQIEVDREVLTRFRSECRRKSKANPISAVYLDPLCKLPVIELNVKPEEKN